MCESLKRVLGTQHISKILTRSHKMNDFSPQSRTPVHLILETHEGTNPVSNLLDTALQFNVTHQI